MNIDAIAVRGKVALVTGAGQGVGRELALTFAEAGAHTVVVNDLVASRAQAVAAECKDLGAVGIAAPGDVTSWESMESVIASADGGVDILVNNAGIPPMSAEEATRGGGKDFVDTTPSDWKPWIEVNLHGSLIATRLCLPSMIDKGWGRVINIVSDASRVGEKKMVVYGAAKAAVAGMARSLAKEVGRNGITVNSVAIGATRTPTVEEGVSEETLQAIARLYPVRRIGEPEDIAGMVLLLASDAGSWITGQTIAVNGGYSAAL